MNRIERRVRSMINPYSTAFAIWWCHRGREWRMPHEWASPDRGLARPIMQRGSKGGLDAVRASWVMEAGEDGPAQH